MNLAEYIKGLQELVDTNPELAKAKLVALSDDEGNEVRIINWEPSVAFADKLDIKTGRYLDNHLYYEEELEEMREDGEEVDLNDFEKVVVLV